MNPIPVLIIVFLTLGFETLLLGDDVNQSVAPYQIHIDTTREDCGNLDVGCGLMNFARPVLGGIAVIVNGIIFVGGLATFNVPGAPDWLRATFGTLVSFSLIWSIITLLRGTR